MTRSMRRALLCVVTGNYLPMAATMAASYHAHHPEHDIRILLVDVAQAEASKISVPSLPALRCDGLDAITTAPHEKMRQYLDASEMIGALRSSYIKKMLFEEGYGQIVMLDADIYCYAPLTPFFEALETHSIALTPHVNSPVPQDGALPDDLELLTVGMINNGSCAVRADDRAKQALDWLEAKVSRNCFVIPELNLYNEQSWVSLLPWYFPADVALVRDAGLNVAYWNLYERTLNGRGQVNDTPLRFFHFSGYSLKNPKMLSTHSARGDTAKDTALAALVKQYCEKLAEGYRLYPSIAGVYSYAQGPVQKRLKDYIRVWGEKPVFYAQYQRLQWLGLRHIIRRVLKGLR